MKFLIEVIQMYLQTHFILLKKNNKGICRLSRSPRIVFSRGLLFVVFLHLRSMHRKHEEMFTYLGF